MGIENSCSPECNSSDILIINNGHEDLIFCKNCSLLQKKELENYKNKVIQLDKFNKDVKQVIEEDYFKKQIIENKSILNKILSITRKNPTKIYLLKP